MDVKQWHEQTVEAVPCDLDADAEEDKGDDAKDSVGGGGRDGVGDPGGVGVAEIDGPQSTTAAMKRPTWARRLSVTVRWVAWTLRVSMTTMQPGPAVMGKVKG